ncbi:MAG TPA: putative quinol monooxygenase [Pseudomonadales bacterium]|nr:putative quinol monooxygenase [Pseudomonadales bacterium]
MIAVIAKLPVKAGSETEFETAFLALAAAVRENELGNHLYTLCKNDDGYLVMELYEDEAALEAHGKTTHFKELGAALGPYMAGRPEISRLQVVG